MRYRYEYLHLGAEMLQLHNLFHTGHLESVRRWIRWIVHIA